jgi:hypothetical protein
MGRTADAAGVDGDIDGGWECTAHRSMVVSPQRFIGGNTEGATHRDC